MSLTGGHLLDDLARCGMVPTEITDVILTHLHADHIGWLFDRSAVAVFPAATLWFGQGDWSHFVTGAGEMADHIRAGVLAPRCREQTHALGPACRSSHPWCRCAFHWPRPRPSDHGQRPTM